MKLLTPLFESEDQEADWWYAHRALVEAELLVATAEGRLQQRSASGESIALPPRAVSTQALREARELLEKSGIWVMDDFQDGVSKPDHSNQLLKAS